MDNYTLALEIILHTSIPWFIKTYDVATLHRSNIIFFYYLDASDSTTKLVLLVSLE